MRLRPVPVQIGPGSSDVVAYITDGGLSVIRSTDDIPGEGKIIHVSVSCKDRDPTAEELQELAHHFIKGYYSITPGVRYPHTSHIYEEKEWKRES